MLTLDQVKSKSNAKLVGLQPVVLAATLLLIKRCYDRGIPIVITQGLRTIAEQDALYAQGRTAKGNIVTNAKGGTSYHNYGLAIDFAILLPDGKSVSWDTARDGNGDKVSDWLEVAQEAKSLGFSWGGDWTSFKDYSHFEMNFGLSTTQLRSGRVPAQAAVDAVYAKINKLAKEAESVNQEVKVGVYVDGVKVGDGKLEAGVTYLPVRVVAEALGASVNWKKEQLRVDIERGN
jgi:peptidoglycan L-alanyl-D-glutamate endopeptidase CwlK